MRKKKKEEEVPDAVIEEAGDHPRKATVEETVDAFMAGYNAECTREFGGGHVNGQAILRRRLTEFLSK